MKEIGTNTIETERLILRRIEISDAPLIFKNWTNDLNVTKYLTWDKHEALNVTEEYVKYKVERYKKEYCYDFLVLLKENNEPIGEIEAVNVSKLHNLVEVGYCYGQKFWNKGYATEALIAFIDYMFNKVEVDKVIACHISLNEASGRVMQKAGMHFDACLKNYFIDKNTNKRVDKVCYSIDRV